MMDQTYDSAICTTRWPSAINPSCRGSFRERESVQPSLLMLIPRDLEPFVSKHDAMHKVLV
jgi:hypothetical protein